MAINRKLVKVFCDKGTMIILRRVDGSVDFNRNWEEFALGFGNFSADFWFGLSNMHALTSARSYKVRFDMKMKDGTAKYAEYASFEVDSEANNFTLSLDAYSGDAGDDFNLQPQNGMMFTTKDRNNDKWSYGNCPQLHGGGFGIRYLSMSV